MQCCSSLILPGRMKTKHLSDTKNKILSLSLYSKTTSLQFPLYSTLLPRQHLCPPAPIPIYSFVAESCSVTEQSKTKASPCIFHKSHTTLFVVLQVHPSLSPPSVCDFPVLASAVLPETLCKIPFSHCMTKNIPLSMAVSLKFCRLTSFLCSPSLLLSLNTPSSP